LRQLFAAYVDRKEHNAVLDYDDLLLFWHGLLSDPAAGAAIRGRFDCVLVDEYQDTNLLQAEILQLLKPDGQGVTIVGDDAQSIYSFRAATVRNILDFPKTYPGTVIVPLERNYRSTQPILDVTNRIIEQAGERHEKNLWTDRKQGEPPSLVHCLDEDEQTDFVVQQILERREAGIELRKQAVLFRASQHSMHLELELSRRNIPFHKYGGLKFVETSHVKDLMAFLRLAENPRDFISGMRILLLLPGIGPVRARDLMSLLEESGGDFRVWDEIKPPAAAQQFWENLPSTLAELASPKQIGLPQQIQQIQQIYAELLEINYDNASARLRDIEQMEQIAGRFGDRATFLAEITLDPPSSTQDLAGTPSLDDDYLILSTIHSSKGLEWDTVYVLHAADGSIPADRATKNDAEIEEELRLFYVALTRAKNSLYVCFPQNYHLPGRYRDAHSMGQLTRFISKPIREMFAEKTAQGPMIDEEAVAAATTITPEMIREKARSQWV